MRHRHTRRRLIAYLLAALVVAGGMAWPALHRGYDAALLVAALGDLELPHLLDPRAAVTRTAVRYRRYDQEHVADRYQPAAPKAGMVLVHGAARGGKDDPRLAAFATALAGAGFEVLVPDMADLKSLRLRAESGRDVAAAFAHLAATADLPAGRPLGLGSLSVAIGPVARAATGSAIADEVDFLFAVGPYYDLPRTLRFFTTGHYRAHGVTLRRDPVAYAKWVFALSNTDRLAAPRDRRLLERLARRRLEDPATPVGRIRERLSPPGRAVYDFLANTDPARAVELYRGLPEAVRREVADLDLARLPLGRLCARVILVHGRDDPIIPYPESLALAAALPEGRAEVFIPAGLQHVETAPSLAQGWHLWRAAYALLQARDGAG